MVGTLQHLLLKKIYSNYLQKIHSSVPTLSRQLELNQDDIKLSLSEMVNDGSVIETTVQQFSLTDLGRKKFSVVMTGGTFDILHVGHIFTFEQAKMLGDVLAIVIATDKTVQRFKQHPPTNSQKDRVSLVRHLREVDAAIEGSEADFFDTVEFIQPDIIALGFDQKHNEKDLYKKLNERGLSHVKIIRLKKHIPGKSTSKIVQDIIKHSYRDEDC
ncbi:MAG: FAD synthase [Candidatus Heimdallarchaeota archaeon]|nr:FAD synthase [Candidatus Heimdallarchaeota archaeon]